MLSSKMNTKDDKIKQKIGISPAKGCNLIYVERFLGNDMIKIRGESVCQKSN